MPTGGRDEDSPWGSVLGKGSERGTVFEIAEGDQARHTLLGNQKPKLLEGVRPFQERRHYEVLVWVGFGSTCLTGLASPVPSST
jgi:hypothetical protein